MNPSESTDGVNLFRAMQAAASWLPLVLSTWLAGFAGPAVAAGPAARAAVSWAEGIPVIEVTITEAPAAVVTGTVVATATLLDGTGKQLWTGPVPIACQGAAPWKGAAKMSPQPLSMDAQYRVELGLDVPPLGLVHAESIVFSGPAKPLLFRALRRSGSYPQEVVSVAIRMAGTRDRAMQATTLDWVLRDAAENILMQKQETVPVGEQATDCEVALVPDRRAVGPFKVECNLANDAGLALGWTDRFPYATAVVPVSSMETDDMPDWFRSTFPDPKGMGTPPWGGRPQVPFGGGHRCEPAVFDAAVAHGGTRSLRLDYTAGQPAAVYGQMALPGFPTRARIWVKGNGSQDRLVVYWQDRFMTPGGPADYGTAALFIEPVVLGTLDFDGWRCFTVPVLGRGLQTTNKTFVVQGGVTAGSENLPTVPISLCAIAVEPGPPAKDQPPGPAARTVWIDDLAVETQVPFDRRASMDVRGDTPDRRLHDEAQLVVSIGNGADTVVKGGRLSLTAKDRSGKAVGEITETLDILPGEFGVKTIPLAGFAKEAADGPIDIDVLFTDPTSALRSANRVVFKRSNSAGLYWDFERSAAFSGVFGSGGTSFGTAAGGAEGSAMALAVSGTAETSVLLHPALPGITDRIEAFVKGGPAPVDLYPVFLDAGNTGAGTPFNQFRLPPIRVDWQGWRKIAFAAPPVPANYGDRTKPLLLKPRHPLNLAFTALPVDGKPVDIRIDDIRVWTHLPPEERLMMEIEYPNDLQIHPPGAPLNVVLANFSDAEQKFPLAYTVRNLRDASAPRQEREVVIPPGARASVRLQDSLSPGLYAVQVSGPQGKTLEDNVTALDPRAIFGASPEKALGDLRTLEKSLTMNVRKANLDWDNLEKVPGVFTYSFFHNDVKRLLEQGYTVVPGLGFSADWAGPEQQENVANAQYARNIGNQLQTPVRLADWNTYAREVFREFKGRFAAWSFWENPDIAEGSTFIPPGKYRDMLGVLERWQTMYDPQAKLIADGFNSDHVLAYLDKIEKPHTLPFDRIGVQMRIGELSPEQADFEGLLAELDAMLQLRQTGRQVAVPTVDWSVGRYVTLADQAAYHARARLILDAQAAVPYQCNLVNSSATKTGFGLFYQVPFGNTPNVAGNRPGYIPRPAYFALLHADRFLAAWKFGKSVRLPDDDLRANRAYVYGNAQGGLVAAVWRTDTGQRSYAVPAGWRGSAATDVFGFPVPALTTLVCSSTPLFVYLPAGYRAEQLIDDLRTLTPTDGTTPVLRDLHVSEADSTARANYRRTGTTTVSRRVGRIAAAGSWDESFVGGIESEQFEFTAPQAGDAVLSRHWFADAGTGQKLHVRFNDGPEQPWDLSFPTNEKLAKLFPAGIRRSTFVLRGGRAGVNRVAIRYETPGACAGYRVEPLAAAPLDLAQWGLLTAVQSVGDTQRNQNVTGGPLTIGKNRYATGLGSHAAAVIECPLDGQFTRFEVTVGIDGSTDGKGSVVFRILVDDAEKVKTKVMTGFSNPETLTVEGLGKARRLTLVVDDGGDGQQNDLANWVNGKLFLEEPR
jgi:hypothetical protein